MNKKTEIETITNSLINLDLQTINEIKNHGYQLDLNVEEKLNKLKNTTELDQIIKIFNDLSDEMLTQKRIELVIFFDQFKVRYIYLQKINRSLNASKINHFNQTGEEIKFPEMFTSFYISFFYFQIQKFAEDFLIYLNDQSSLNQWNLAFAKNLTEEINQIIIAKEIIEQLELIEQWVVKYGNPDLLFNLIDFQFDQDDRQKEEFINHFNEFKLALQTIDQVIDLMAKKVKEQ